MAEMGAERLRRHKELLVMGMSALGGLGQRSVTTGMGALPNVGFGTFGGLMTDSW